MAKKAKKKTAKKKAARKKAKAKVALKPGQLLSPSHVAARHGVSNKTVHKAIVAKELPATFIIDANGTIVARGVASSDSAAWNPKRPKDWRDAIRKGHNARKKKAAKKKATKKTVRKKTAKKTVSKAEAARAKKRERDRRYRAKKKATKKTAAKN